MFDDLDRLRTDPPLWQLLCHYAERGEPNREAWHNRHAQIDGLDPARITSLHGELLGLDWIEQNTGQAPCCYRITLAGLRAHRQFQLPDPDEADQLFPAEPADRAA